MAVTLQVISQRAVAAQSPIMNEQLSSLILLPPPTNTPWSGPPERSIGMDLAAANGERIASPLPLFWYDPPWCDVSTDLGDMIATSVSDAGVLVSALRSDLVGPGREPRFHAPATSELHDSAIDPHHSQGESRTRMMPYRPERYGLCVSDFDTASVVDVRLTMTRDVSGRFAFSPNQIARWEATPAGQPLAGGGWVPAASFPADVISIDHLSSKLDQLRVLAPHAAVLVSMSPYRLQEELPEIMAQGPDGLILRLDDVALDGLHLAAFTRQARRMIDESTSASTPLWVVPGNITPDDAVKLTALGASAVAVDSWCSPIITETAERERSIASHSTYAAPESIDQGYIGQLVGYYLSNKIARFDGLGQSLLRVQPDRQLGSLDRKWAETLNVYHIASI